MLACILAFPLVQVASAGASITLYPIPNSAYPTSLVAAGDGNLWFTTEHTSSEIGEITPSGTVSLHPFTFPFETSEFIGVGPGGRLLLTDRIQQVTGNLFSFDTATVTYNPLTDISNENEWITGAVTDHNGAIWYDRSNQNSQIDRISPEGPSYPVPFGEIEPIPYNGLEGLAIDNSGTFWMLAGNGVVSMTADGVFTLYPTDCATTEPPVVDGALIWFPCLFTSGAAVPAVQSLDPATRQITTYNLPPEGLSYPHAMVVGPEGAIWFSMLWTTEWGISYSNIVRITPNGSPCYVGLPEGQSPSLVGDTASFLTVGSDNALWFATSEATNINEPHSSIGRMTTDTPCSPTPIAPPTTPPNPVPPIPTPPVVTVVHPIVLPKVESLQIQRVKQGFGVLGFGLSEGSYTELLVAMTVPEFSVGLFASELALDAVDQQIVNDPPRDDFNRVARFPTVRASGHGRSSNAWNQLAANTLREAVLSRALLLSIERLHGAAAAGQCSAVHEQDGAIVRFATALRAAFSRDTKLRSSLRRQLTGRYRARVITVKQFAAVQRRVRRSGLPKPIIAALRASGLTPAEITSFAQSFVKAAPRNEKFATALSSQPLSSVLKALRTLSVTAKQSSGACQTSAAK
jgi:streptogramin lyase